MGLVEYLLIGVAIALVVTITMACRYGNNQLPENFKIKELYRIEDKVKPNIIKRIVIEIRHDSFENKYVVCGRDSKFNYLYYLKTWTSDKEICFEHTDKYARKYDTFGEALKIAEHCQRLMKTYLDECEVLKLNKEKYKTVDYLYIDEYKTDNKHHGGNQKTY